jgi:alpha-tubulin suppressor-like RCC1 family protein
MSGYIRFIGRAISITIASVCSLVIAVPATAAEAPLRATSITADSGHTCATTSSGQVYCWGYDYISGAINHEPVLQNGIAGAVSVSAGLHYNCALLQSGDVVCWGDDGYGQLGDGNTVDSTTPVAVVGVQGAVAVSTGSFHACAILQGGQVKCWGRNDQGGLGDGTTIDRSTPVFAKNVRGAVQVYAGGFTDETCAVVAGGEVRCWGSNGDGQLGIRTRIASYAPVAVRGISGARQVAASGAHTCVVVSEGRVQCLGSNASGQLGNGTYLDSLAPVTVLGLPPATSVASDPLGYSCAVTRAGEVYCWGHNPKDQLGDGLQPLGSPVAVRVMGVSGATAVSTGTGHACALLSSGGADCWGYDDYGQLGDGGLAPLVRNATAVDFPFGPGAATVSSGSGAASAALPARSVPDATPGVLPAVGRPLLAVTLPGEPSAPNAPTRPPLLGVDRVRR